MTEIIDIYDASLRPIGTMEREAAHLSAHWHRTFHCWVVNTVGRELIFQVRSFNSKTHPGKLDISAAGHLAEGETVAQGIREVQEELGIVLTLDALIAAGERVEVSDSPNGVRNREYQSVFFLPLATSFLDFTPDPVEVAGLASMPIQAGLDLFAERLAEITVQTVDVEPGMPLVPRMRTITREQFVPRLQRYYMAALIMAERVCDGKRDLAIS